MLPATVLRKMIVGRLPVKLMDSRIADSIDFMVERVSIIQFYATIWTRGKVP